MDLTRLVQGGLLLVLGVGVLAIALRSLATGWLPCGPRGLDGRVEFRRDDQPGLYWLMFAVYAAGGLAVAIYSLGVLLGTNPPLPMR